MKQKKLLILLALLAMLSSIGANAAPIPTSGTCGTNLTWELTELTGSEGKYTLTISGSGAMSDFNNANKQPWKGSRDKIAALVLGSGVTTIGKYAFNSFTNLESVTIPGDVTSIGNNAFGKCTSLTTVSIGNGVTTIGSSAFSGCTSLEEVTIPNGVKVIPNGAFANCTNLKTVNIPSSVEAIDPGAFNKCTSLENITIPNSVKTIQGTAFQNCTSLKSITIPESVTTIGQQAFAGCTSLEKVTILATEIGFASGVFYNTSANLVIYVPAGSVDTYEAYGNLPENVNIQPITDPTYTVKLADGTKDAAKWTITSGQNSVTGDNADGLTGLSEKDAVTLNYGGRLKVKGVTATTDYDPLATPLTVEALTAGTIVVNITNEDDDPVTLQSGMKYSVNGGTTKTPIYETTEITVAKGDKVQFYGNGTDTQVYGDYPEVSILGSGDGFQTKVYGNIMSLLDETGFATMTELPEAEYVFYELFAGNTTLIDASELLLPATTLKTGCYEYMFEGCTNLTTTPKLPAETLAMQCYEGMFMNCTSLTTAPKLPATKLATKCYSDMFYRCSSLTNAYVKAAYTKVTSPCSRMFTDCTAPGAFLHTTSGNMESWENMMGMGKTWPNWTVTDDWQD